MRQFQIEVRLNSTDEWRTVLAGERIGEQWAADFERVTARFVRLHMLAYEGPGATLWEFQVYDRADTWEAVGPWSGTEAQVDLSVAVNEPGQYELQFVDAAGKPVAVESAELRLDGQVADAACLTGAGTETLRLSRTQAVTPDSRTAIRARLRAAAGAAGAARLKPVW